MNARERLEYAAGFDNSSDDKKAQREPSDIWRGLETSGWPDLLGNFQLRFQAGRSYLTLFKKLPRWPIDMRSPDRFKRSMSAREIVSKSSIGHMSVGWSCASAEKREEGFAAQTGEDGQQSEMLKNGWGITSLISTFTDGRLQSGAEVQRYFSTTYREKNEQGDTDSFFALVIEVPTPDCEKVREFVKSYVFHPTKPYRNFGMLPDPLQFEGAGCGSFAIAALSNASSLSSMLSTFWRTVPISEKLLGRRSRVQLPNDVVPFVYAKTAKDEYEISRYRLVLMNWDSGTTALNVRLVDPELTVFSFKKLAEMARSSSHKATRFQLQHLSPLTRIYNFPSKNDDGGFADKDSGYQEIDAAFDSSFGQVSKSVEQWWHERQHSSQINLVSFPLGVGVMVESR